MIIVYVSGGLLLLLLLQTWLMPGSFRLVRSAEINSNSHAVSSFVSNFNNYNRWNPWLERDATVQIQVTGEPGKPGHRLNWEGKKAGAGSLELSSASDTAITWKVSYRKPWKSFAEDLWDITSTDSSRCRITWTHRGQLPWPFARLMGGLIRRNLGYQFEQALRNLESGEIVRHET